MKTNNTLRIFSAVLTVLVLIACFFVYSPVKASANGTQGDLGAAGTVGLSEGTPIETEAFHAIGMLAGDSQVKAYNLDITYKDSIAVFFQIRLRDGYEKLSQALKFRVELDGVAQPLYDGYAKDLPQQWTTRLPDAEDRTTAGLSYTITAYLETAAGSDYQNLSLVADFIWSVDNEDNLLPATGDYSNIGTALLFLILTGTALISVLPNKKRENYKSSRRRLINAVSSVLVLVCLLTTATMAYEYSIKQVDDNLFTTGEVSIELRREQEAYSRVIYPNDTVEESFTIRNNGTCDVFYKVYVSNIQGELAKWLEVTVKTDGKVLFSGNMEEFNGAEDSKAVDVLKYGEEKTLTVTIHMSEDSDNSAQGLKLSYDLNVDAVQTKNNHDAQFD